MQHEENDPIDPVLFTEVISKFQTEMATVDEAFSNAQKELNAVTSNSWADLAEEKWQIASNKKKRKDKKHTPMLTGNRPHIRSYSYSS